ncbi:DsbA family protein [Streptomyces sp. A30]|uniref:DsbA family protein n=1 Tax=Streptomyces sp. A30 TaxID=2789273 RepID=UPI003980DCF2
MIRDFHRAKGGALLLGAAGPGLTGPFGAYGAAVRDDGDMEIEVLLVDNCAHEKAAVAVLRRALDDAGLKKAAFTTRVIADQAEAERAGFTGSPTFLIDGRDPFADPDRPPGLACRMYRTADGGLAGVPDAAELRHALEVSAGLEPGPSPSPPRPGDLSGG